MTFSRRALLLGTAASLFVARNARASFGFSDWDLPARDLSGTRSTWWPVHGLRERWRVTAAGGVTGAALVLGEMVIAASMGGEVIAIDLMGHERWRRALGTAAYTGSDGERALGFFAGPAAARGRVLVASDRVYCLDPKTGATLWTSAPLRTSDSDDYFWGGVTVVGDTVLAGSGSGGETPTARGRLTAYDLNSGKLRWSKAMVEQGAHGGGILSPATFDLLRGSVFVSTGAPYADDGTPIAGASSLVELALTDGRVRYRDALPIGEAAGLDLNSAPLLLGRFAFATAKDGVWAWDRYARRRVWHTALTPSSSAPGAPSGPTDGPEGGPIASDGYQLYALSNDGAAGTYTAAALRPHTGEVLWRRELPGYAFAAPALAGGVLYTASAAGTLHALRCADGAVVGEAPLPGPSAGAVSSARGRVLVGVGAAPYLPGEELLCFG